MRFALLIGIFSLLLVGALFAEGSSNVTCPSESSLQAKISACQSANYTAGYYVTEAGCKDVKCAPIPKTYACPTEDEMHAKISACQAYNNYGYEIYVTSAGCKDVKCTLPSTYQNSTTNTGSKPETDSTSNVSTINCPTEGSLNEKATACKNANYNVEYYVDSATGCKSIKCTYAGTNAKPDKETTGSKSNLTTTKDKTTDTKAAACTKKMEGSCIVISCSDGFALNTCKLGDYCTAQKTTAASDTSKTTCPSDGSLKEKMARCATYYNASYEYYTTSAGCKDIKCTTTAAANPTAPSNCPSGTSLKEKAARCQAANTTYIYTTINGCAEIRCK